MSDQVSHLVSAVEVIAQDHELVVVNKPAGVSVHNEPGNLIDLLTPVIGERLKPVHRLDRETSGVLLLARGREAAASLQRRLQSRDSTKEYLAVVRGAPKRERGLWDAPLSPRAEGRKSPAGKRADRVDAQTRFEVIAHNQWLSLLRCELVTGRQHQIRRHAALAGCHLVGDRRYGDPKHASMIERRYSYRGLALHAARLTLRATSDVQGQSEAQSWSALSPEAWRVFEFEFDLTPQPI